MKSDHEVQRMLRERHHGKTLDRAAARTGMSVSTARKYLRACKLPNHLKAPRSYRTRPDPFATDWPWVQAQLARDPALQAKTLFALLCDRAPGRYQPNQLRMLQRHIASRRALHAPEQEVIFVQVHQPGRMAQSDFTHMTDLGVILAGSPFPHLVYYLVLTYSSVDAVQICFSESFESLAEGLEACLWQIGGVPQFHRTDNLSPAVHVLDRGGRKQFTDRYQALMTHYGLQPTTNTPAEAHENGDVDKRTTASTRPSTKPAACAAAVTLWTAPPMRSFCTIWCGSATAREDSCRCLSGTGRFASRISQGSLTECEWAGKERMASVGMTEM